MTIIDLTVRGLLPGTYDATVRAAGDISRGVASTGGVWEGEKGRLGTVEVGALGAGSVLVDRPIEVWELIGRSIAVEKRGEKGETIVGVIARSAGVWENEKTVGCAHPGRCGKGGANVGFGAFRFVRVLGRRFGMRGRRMLGGGWCDVV